MKTELKAKFIQHILGKKKDNEGFTLIELLVVIIIIGILSAIALPSFLNQAAKAKQSEAKTYVGSVNRAQQGFRIEKPSFATDLTELQIGIPTQTPNYVYEITEGKVASTTFTATPVDPASLKGVAGGVIILASGQTSALGCIRKAVDSSGTVPTLAFDTAATDQGVSCDTDSEDLK
jgi:type IV pilus assembly protein PilA